MDVSVVFFARPMRGGSLGPAGGLQGRPCAGPGAHREAGEVVGKSPHAVAASPSRNSPRPCVPAGESHCRVGRGWLVAALGVAVALLAPVPTPAAMLTWDTTDSDNAVVDGSGAWDSLSSDWTSDGGISNVGWIGGDDAIFGGGTEGTAGTVTLGEAITVGNITFALPYAGTYTIDTSSYAMTLNSGITANTDAAINGTVTLGGNNAWNVSAGNLSVGAAVGDGGGARSLTKDGAGTLTLSGNNSFTGPVTLNAEPCAPRAMPTRLASVPC